MWEELHRALLERLGTLGDRVVLGSDFPFDMGLDDPLATVTSCIFAPRCAYATAHSRAVRPELRATGFGIMNMVSVFIGGYATARSAMRAPVATPRANPCHL